MVFILAISTLALLISAFFSTAEVAIFSIRSQNLKILRERNDPRVQWVDDVLAHPRKFLITILLGNAIANATVAFGLTLFCWKMLSPFIRWVPLVATSVLLTLFGELIPKTVATRRINAFTLYLVGCLRMLEKIVHPVTEYMDRLSYRWAVRLVPSSMRPLQGLTKDEYLTTLDVGTREGALRPSEKRLIERTLRLANRRLRELMTPRSEMCCLEAEIDFGKMKEQAQIMRHRRLPIYSGSLDSIVGIINIRRFLLEPEVDVIACIEPPAFVPETMTALELLKSFLRGPQRMTMVVDEFGGVEGLITLEDLVEEVFGEIYDEYDDDSPQWEKIDSNTFVARGSIRLSDVSYRLGVDLEIDGVDTLGGWIADKMGALPRVGDRYLLGGYWFQVEKMHRFRVETILIGRERGKS